MPAADENIHGPFFEALEKFKDYLLLERGCSQNTVKAYISDISFWHAYCIKMGFEPEKLSAESISRFLREQTVKGKAKSTIQRNAAVLNSFACFLVYDGELSKMPKLDPLPKIDDKLPQIMTENDSPSVRRRRTIYSERGSYGGRYKERRKGLRLQEDARHGV